MKTNNISKVPLYSCQNFFTSHMSTVGVEVSKVCFSPWYLVLSTLFVLTYHPCIRSSVHINFTSLAIISPISNENYVTITYVTLKAPGSEKTYPELHIERMDLQLLSNKLQILYLSGNAKKIIYNVL